ncbi:MAG: phosphotransferase family protein [Rhodobacteraceae bacterium]|nr:phosphotransferase family protein [Paracoccaceae bacterium]
MSDLTANPALAAWLAKALEADEARVTGARKLSGGAIQENWALDVATGGQDHALVLRRDAPATIGASRTRAQEYALLDAAHAAGVLVPRPVGFCGDAQVIGAPFAVLERVAGEGYGPKVVRDTALGGDRDALARELGRQLARIHAITPEAEVAAILGPRPDDPAVAEIALLRGWLDDLGAPHAGLEWALRQCEIHAPAPGGVVFAHRDYRTGNYMVDAQGLTAVLDWEFAGWGDPMADIGWFCAACWRFARPDLEAGGIADRAHFYDGYEAQGGRLIDPARVGWWEVMAHIRWAVIALQQEARHSSGAERALHLQLTGRIADTLDWAILRMTAPGGITP